MPKISVIVPVYNTGKYVKKCLDSLINQTMKDQIEIILINDGSEDDSEEFIQKYIQDLQNKEVIRYYFKKNDGIAEARNYGIKEAKGEYILFVDSDDYVDTTLIEKLMPYVEKDLDLIKFKLKKVNTKGDIIEKVNGPIFENKIGEEAFNLMYSEDVLIDSPCVYLIKKELFTKNNLKFRRTYHEDFGLIPLVILMAKSVVSTNYYLYSYVQIENSITRNDDHNKTIARMNDILAHYDYMMEKVEQLDIKPITKENVKLYYANAIILKLDELNGQDKKQYEQEIKKRKVYKNIKARNFKQLIKKMLVKIDINLYLKMRGK